MPIHHDDPLSATNSSEAVTPKAGLRAGLLLSGVLLWILLILGGYYYYHKPISLDMIGAPAAALLDLALVGLIAGLAGGLGQKILPARIFPPLERMAMHFGLGAGLIAFVWLGFGFVGLWRFPLAVPLLLVGNLLLRRNVGAWWQSFTAVGEAWRRAGTLERVLAGLSATLVLYQLLLALAPPTKWDALTYHLQMPRQYLEAGRLIFLPENPYWGHPQLVEMLYTLGASAHRVETASVIGWAAGVIFLLGLLSFTNTRLAILRGDSGSTNAGWMAVTAVVAGYTFRNLLSWAYTDGFSALFGLCGLILFLAWLDNDIQDAGRGRWLLWAGVFAGLAAGTKWTAGVLALGIFLAALIFRKQTGPRWKTFLLAGGLAFLVVTPWLLKNLLVTGSPLYPYFFPTETLNAARMASANEFPPVTDWWLHLLLPLTTTWTGVDSAPGFSADLGPLLLLFALPGFIRWWRADGDRSPQARVMAFFLIPAALAMGIASIRMGHLMQTRLYFVLLPCLAVPAGWGWDWLQGQVLSGVRLRRIAGAVALLVMGLVFWQETHRMAQITPGSLLLGAKDRQAYQEETLGYHILAMQSMEELPADSRILMLWEPRGLYAPLNAQADLWIDRWRTDVRELGSAPAILQRWKGEGFTHVLLYEQGLEIIRPQEGQSPTPNWTVMEAMLPLLGDPISDTGPYQIYALP